MRISAIRRSRGGVFCDFLTKLCSTTIRRPTSVQKNTRAIPSAPFKRSSNSPSPKALVCGSPRLGPSNHTARQHDIPGSESVRKTQDLVLNTFAVVGDRVIHRDTITNMLLLSQCQGTVDLSADLGRLTRWFLITKMKLQEGNAPLNRTKILLSLWVSVVRPLSGTETPCEPQSSAVTPGGVGEDCLSPGRAAARASCAPRRKSPWVAAALRDEQRREVRRTGEPGRFFFGYFLLSAQKKVTSCRATPGEVEAPRFNNIKSKTPPKRGFIPKQAKHYSGFAPEAFTTFAHFLVSDLM